MNIKDLVPRFGRKPLPARREEEDPFRDFQREMNRLFDDFFGEFPVAVRREGGEWGGGFVPRVDVSETDTEVRVTAELPGMDEKDVDVELRGGVLSIRGERRDEQEEKGKNWHRREQSYGAFSRAVELPAEVDATKATARFRKGVLTFAAPKLREEKGGGRRVPIEAE